MKKQRSLAAKGYKYADETEVKAAQLMTPELANIFGNIHGGHVMHFVDNIAFVCATRFARTVCATVSIDRMDFHAPVHVGELLHFVARINYVGRTSLQIEVEVSSENVTTGQVRHTNTSQLTFVALKNGKPTPVPRLTCRTREDKMCYLRAKMLREMGLRYRDEKNRVMGRFNHLGDKALDKLIAQDNIGRKSSEKKKTKDLPRNNLV